jgi:hypothetical protein
MTKPASVAAEGDLVERPSQKPQPLQPSNTIKAKRDELYGYFAMSVEKVPQRGTIGFGNPGDGLSPSWWVCCSLFHSQLILMRLKVAAAEQSCVSAAGHGLFTNHSNRLSVEELLHYDCKKQVPYSFSSSMHL